MICASLHRDIEMDEHEFGQKLQCKLENESVANYTKFKKLEKGESVRWKALECRWDLNLVFDG